MNDSTTIAQVREALALLRQLPQLIIDSDLVDYNWDWLVGYDQEFYKRIQAKQMQIQHVEELSVMEFLDLVHEQTVLFRQAHRVKLKLGDEAASRKWYQGQRR